MIQRDSPPISSDVSSSYAAPFIGAELTLSKLEENVNGLCVSFLSSQFELESKTVDFQVRLLTDPSEKDFSALYQEMLLNRCFKVNDPSSQQTPDSQVSVLPYTKGEGCGNTFLVFDWLDSPHEMRPETITEIHSLLMKENRDDALILKKEYQNDQQLVLRMN